MLHDVSPICIGAVINIYLSKSINLYSILVNPVKLSKKKNFLTVGMKVEIKNLLEK